LEGGEKSLTKNGWKKEFDQKWRMKSLTTNGGWRKGYDQKWRMENSDLKWKMERTVWPKMEAGDLCNSQAITMTTTLRCSNQGRELAGTCDGGHAQTRGARSGRDGRTILTCIWVTEVKWLRIGTSGRLLWTR
jgi:hypothetical protein